MMAEQIERKLTTILAADAEGYSHAMAVNEEGALSALRASRQVFKRLIERYKGRIANTAGDGLIAEFPSPVEAVRCAIEVQQELGATEATSVNPMRFRIGIHLGDVMVDGDDLLGEGVNLAARLETMAPPGHVLVSRQVYDQVHAKLSVGFDYLGQKRPKNFTEDVDVYQITHGKPAKSAPKRVPAADPQVILADTVSQVDAVAKQHAPRVVKILGLVAGVTVVINLVTGGGVWAQWPVLLAGTFIALTLAPRYATDRFPVWSLRGAIIVVTLACINLFSWNGSLWFLWPAGAFFVAMVARQILSDRR